MNLGLLIKKWLNHKQTGDYMITEEIRALKQFKNPTSCSLLKKRKRKKDQGENLSLPV